MEECQIFCLTFNKGETNVLKQRTYYFHFQLVFMHYI
jgi:hypothetical protein